MTMVECIEQRKTTLSGVVAAALQSTIHSDGDDTREWGVRIEAAQVAQVFIVDATLRQQLEAEVRNEIKLKADQSNMQAQEQIQLAELESQGRVQEQKLAGDQAKLRRDEEMELAADRPPAAEPRPRPWRPTGRSSSSTRNDSTRSSAADQDRLTSEAPVRLLRLETERAILAEEVELLQLQNQVRALEVERDLLLSTSPAGACGWRSCRSSRRPRSSSRPRGCSRGRTCRSTAKAASSSASSRRSSTT